MTAKLDELIEQISLLSTTKEASAKTTPEDNLVSILQGISSSLNVKKAEDENAETPVEEAAEDVAEEKAEEKAEGSESAADAAEAIIENPHPIANAVANAVAQVMVEKNEGAEGSMDDKLIQKISSVVASAIKTAVEGDAAFGVAGDASQGNEAGAGNVQNMAQKILDAKTTQKTVTDQQMVAPNGATDPMVGVMPTSVGGEQKPLQGSEVKAAMANLSEEDAMMIFKLASIGYDVSVETLSTELAQEQMAKEAYALKVAQEQLARQAYAQKVAQAQYFPTNYYY